jgi:parallel beta-helix repeat protein
MLLRGRDFSIAMLIVFVVSVTGAGVGFGKTIYVDCDATGDPNGSSWPNAYTDLQDALNDPCLAYGDEIWVAEGVYKPTAGSETTARFSLVNGVAMYGGYAGRGAAEPNERDIEAYETVLSGAIGGGNESSRIVLTNGVGAATILDGFEITGGYRGIYSYQSEEIISNCVIAQNSGDGIYCYDSDPAMDNCIIEDNGQDGINPDQDSSVAITSCIVRNNGANGIYYYNAGSSIIANSWIHHNGGDGILFYNPAQAPIVRNNTIVYNSQKGVYRNQGTAPEISNCILWGNTGDDLDLCSATYSCIEDGDAGEGNIATDPNFAYGNPELYNFHLNPISPCIDAGDSNDVEAGEVDIDGDERIYNGVVDMGADEVACEDVYSKSDLNGDGIADSVDHLKIIKAWLSYEGAGNWDGECDLDGDGFVDMKDFAIFGAKWQWEACWR